MDNNEAENASSQAVGDDGDWDPEENYAVGSYSFEQKLEHFLPEGKATPNSLRAVQSALIQRAGANVSASRTMPAPIQEEKMSDHYFDILTRIPDRVIPPPLKQKLRYPCGAQKIKCGPTDPKITRTQIKRRFEEERRTIRSMYIPLLPKDYHTMISGKGLRKVEDEFIKMRYKEEERAKLMKRKRRDPSISIEAEMSQLMGPGSDFEFKYLHLMLSVRIFRNSPHFARNAADVQDSEKGPSRAEQRAEACRKERERLEARKSSALVMARAKMDHARALQGLYKVSARQARTTEICTQLHALKEFKDSMTQGDYDKKVSLLLSKMPDPDTFESAVVIDLTQDEEEEKENDGANANLKRDGDYEEENEEPDTKKPKKSEKDNKCSGKKSSKGSNEEASMMEDSQ